MGPAHERGTDTMASKYERIAADLRSKIRSGQLTGQLPAETELATTYHVALNTTRRALDVLESEGLLTTQHGRGTFVRQARQRIRRNHAERYQWEKAQAQLSDDARKETGASERDTGLGFSDLEFTAHYSQVPASPELAQRFNIADGTPLLCREYQTRPRDELAPLSLVTSHLILEMISGNPALLNDTNEPWPGGTHHQLSTVGIEIDKIHDEITARPPFAEEVNTLYLEPGVSVLVLWKTSVDILGRVVEVSEVIMPADRTQVEYTTQLKRWEQ